MPPSFFSKLTRSPTQSRDRRVSSESAVAGRPSRSPSPASARRRIGSILSAAIPPVPSLNTATSSPATSHVNVTVVPPSPHLSEHSTVGWPHNSDTGRTNGIEGLPSANSPNIELNSQKRTTRTEDDSTVADSNLPAKTHTIAHSTSSGNLRESQALPRALPTPELRKQPSDKSMRSVNLPPIAVAPAQPDNAAVTMTPIVESPTAMEYKQSPFNGDNSPSTHTASAENTSTATTSTANTSPATSSLWPPQPPRDSDSASTIAKKHKWRRGSSNQRKPTGLASAIAASGLAMANSGITGVVSPAIPLLSPTSSTSKNSVTRRGTTAGSPPYLGSPPQSTTSHSRGASQDFSSGRNTRRRRRQSTTLSSHSVDHSDIVYGEDNGNYSGLEESSSEGDSSDGDDDLDAFDLDRPDAIPVTGFAVASNKRNADFHELFPSIPDGDYLIEDYGCALQRDILIQGRLYISENHICFHANIFGWITDLMIPIYDILTLEKKMTAFVIPNALLITTRQSKYTFASFLARDTTYDVIYNIWRLARPEDSVGVAGSSVGGGSARTSFEDARAERQPKRAAMENKVTHCACGKEGKHYSEMALDSVFPGTPDRIYGLIFASGFIKDFMRVDQKLIDVQISDWQPREPDSKLLSRNMSYIKPLTGTFGPKQTKCEIRDDTEHCDFEDYVSTVTTTRTPDVPSGGVFSVKTRTCITWASAVTTRVVVTTQVDWTGRSFVKGIIVSSSIEGQLQYHGDLDKAMRAYIHDHRSEFVPAGMDPAIMDAAESTPAVEEKTTKTVHDSAPPSGTRKKKNDQRGMQWAWDTFSGAYKVGKQSATGAIELLKDVWDNSTSTGILYVIIAVLVASNLWTIVKVNRSKDAEIVRRRERERDRTAFGTGGRIGMEDREKWVQGMVTALWEELAGGNVNAVPTAIDSTPIHTQVAPATTTPAATPLDSKEEIRQLNDALNTIQERVEAMKKNLRGLDEVD